MNLNSKIKIDSTVFAKEVDSEMVIFNANSEQYFGLDEVGTTIWNYIEQSKDLKVVLNNMVEKYDAEKSTLERDLSIFVKELEKSGLVEVVK
jgi:hypothetical protein